LWRAAVAAATATARRNKGLLLKISFRKQNDHKEKITFNLENNITSEYTQESCKSASFSLMADLFKNCYSLIALGCKDQKISILRKVKYL
jgi:hypothetical protein